MVSEEGVYKRNILLHFVSEKLSSPRPKFWDVRPSQFYYTEVCYTLCFPPGMLNSTWLNQIESLFGYGRIFRLAEEICDIDSAKKFILRLNVALTEDLPLSKQGFCFDLKWIFQREMAIVER